MNKPLSVKVVVQHPLQRGGKDFRKGDVIDMPVPEAQALVSATIVSPAGIQAEKTLAAAAGTDDNAEA